MNDSIEIEVRQLREDFSALVQTYLRQNGENHAYRSALLAVISAQPKSEVLNTTVRDELARTEARIVSECESEDHLDGLQQAQNLILLALEKSNKRQA